MWLWKVPTAGVGQRRTVCATCPRKAYSHNEIIRRLEKSKFQDVVKRFNDSVAPETIRCNRNCSCIHPQTRGSLLQPIIATRLLG